MRISVFRRDTCRLCGGDDLELVLRLVPTPIGDNFVSAEYLHKVQEAYPLDLLLCHTCGNVQLLNVIDPAVIYGDYCYVTSI